MLLAVLMVRHYGGLLRHGMSVHLRLRLHRAFCNSHDDTLCVSDTISALIRIVVVDECASELDFDCVVIARSVRVSIAV